MSKKIVFIGPPEAGKTTLRKIFFEGENRKELLEHALEPTHGQETIIVKLKQDIGVFDLAGQENQRWFETEDKSIFDNTEILIVVIDITSPMQEILEFITKIINIRDELTPSSFIFLLLHKKDLLTREKISDIKLKLIRELRRISRLKIAFTSIKKKYFLETLSLFMEILKLCTSMISGKERKNLDLVEDLINILYLINKDVVISKSDLSNMFKLDEKALDNLIIILEKKNYIKITKTHDYPLYSLTDQGKLYFEEILKEFTEEGFKLETCLFETKMEEKSAPPFLGFMIADKDGKTLLTSEVYEGVFNDFFQTKNDEMQPDHDLIPMFINALEKFSTEINIKDLSGFKLKGTNIKMQTFRYDLITVTLFMNADTNIKSPKDEINTWFNNLFTTHEKKFEYSILTGDISQIVQIHNDGTNWLKKLNEEYKEKAINLQIFDFRQATDLYEKLEHISSRVKVSHSILIQKIKNLKNNLMKAIYAEDFQEIREIAKTSSDLKI